MFCVVFLEGTLFVHPSKAERPRGGLPGQASARPAWRREGWGQRRETLSVCEGGFAEFLKGVIELKTRVFFVFWGVFEDAGKAWAKRERLVVLTSWARRFGWAGPHGTASRSQRACFHLN